MLYRHLKYKFSISKNNLKLASLCKQLCLVSSTLDLLIAYKTLNLFALQIPDQQCSKVPVPTCPYGVECWEEDRKECKAVPREVCWVEETKECQHFPRQECTKVSKNNCKKVSHLENSVLNGKVVA